MRPRLGTKRLAFVAFALVACWTCPDHDEIIAILPPADLPQKTGELDVAECQKRCDAGDVVSCSFDEPGGVPTVHCVLPSMCE